MPRLFNLRALCARCECAEARIWAASERTALCEACSHARGVPTKSPIISHSVVTALCARCSVAPAAHLARGPSGDTPLCQLCVKAKGYRPLREARLIEKIVFDRMDFSAVYARDNDKNDTTTQQESQVLTNSERNDDTSQAVDLSYYKTPIPMSIVHSAKKRHGAPETEKTQNGNQRGKASRRKHR